MTYVWDTYVCMFGRPTASLFDSCHMAIDNCQKTQEKRQRMSGDE